MVRYPSAAAAAQNMARIISVNKIYAPGDELPALLPDENPALTAL